MKFKKMVLDGPLNEKPVGSTLQNRNMVLHEFGDSWARELSNRLVHSKPGFVRIGQVVFPGDEAVIFLVGSTSEIGIYNTNTKVYVTKVQDSNLNFNLLHPIVGEATSNEYGERIVAWTDNYNPARILNLDSVLPYNFKSTNLFPESEVVCFSSSLVNTGGSLLTGSYIPMIQLVYGDKSVSDWQFNFNPVYISNTEDGSPSNLISGKAIQLSFQITNDAYKYVNIGYIYRKDGQLFPKLITQIKAFANNSYTINGGEDAVDISLSEVLNRKANYKTVADLTQINNVLYGANVTTRSEPSHQLIANKTVLKWDAKEINPITDRTQKGFAHFEVYAFYIRYLYKWGKGSWWHIPGREPEPQDLVDVTVGDITAKKFQIDDTVKQDGTFGTWENSDTYPDIPEWGTLRGKKVLLHRFPSFSYVKQNTLTSPQLGLTTWSRLGIKVENVELPNDPDCIGYEIGYAERTGSNSLVIGYSTMLFDVKEPGNLNTYPEYSIGMNGNMANSPALQRVNKIRTYPFELLIDNSSASPTFVRKELKYSTPVQVFGIIKEAPDPDEPNKPIVRVLGLVDQMTGSVSIPSGNKLVQIKNFGLLPANTQARETSNFLLETTYLADITSQADFPISSPSYNPAGFTEENILLQLLFYRTNLYAGLFTQNVVSTGKNQVSGCIVPVIYGGDVNAGDYTFHTYGKRLADDEHYNLPDRGYIYTRRHLTESFHNIGMRHVAATDERGYTNYFPKENPIGLTGYPRDWSQFKNPNNFVDGYNRDFSMINNLENGLIRDSTEQDLTKRPFDVIRSQIYESTDNVFNWRDFRVADVYQMPKHRGKIIAITGNEDELFIHHEFTLYRTVGKTRLQTTDGKDIYAGTGDIFSIKPDEVLHGEHGAIGLQHKFGCCICSYGYVSWDSQLGKVWIINDSVTEVSDNGLLQWFRDNSTCHADNPFNGEGLQIVYNDRNRRLLLIRRHKELVDPSRFKGVWNNSPLFIASLAVGDIVFKDGKYKRITTL